MACSEVYIELGIGFGANISTVIALIGGVKTTFTERSVWGIIGTMQIYLFVFCTSPFILAGLA